MHKALFTQSASSVDASHATTFWLDMQITNKFDFNATLRDSTRSVWTLTIFDISLIWRVDALGVNGLKVVYRAYTFFVYNSGQSLVAFYAWQFQIIRTVARFLCDSWDFCYSKLVTNKRKYNSLYLCWNTTNS